MVALDGRPVKTPARRTLTLPDEAFASALAAEWNAQGEEVDPPSMRLTRLANTALDRTASLRQQVIDEVAGYAQSDLLCYRADAPAELVALQEQRWQPILDWLAEVHGAPLAVTADIAPLEQEQAALLAVYTTVARHDDFALTGLHTATNLCGSVALGLALACGRIDADEAWACSLLDEHFQAERWGVDAEAKRRWEALRDEIAAAADFLELAHGWNG